MEIIAVANQKGGCGKTTTAINLAACLGNRRKRVLLIDMDPQGHASLGLGQACEEREGLYEVFLREVTLQEVIVPDVAEGVDLVPGTISLAAVEHLLADTPEREWRLASHLSAVAGRYDYGVIDCPPSLGLLAFNALRAADRVVVPVDLSVFALDGVARLNETIDLLAEKYDTEVSITIVPTMVDYRPRFSRDILRELRGLFPGMMSQAVIHSTVRLKEAAYRGVPVIHHAADSMGAMDYDRLAREVMGEKVGRVTVSHFHSASANAARPAPVAEQPKAGGGEEAEPLAAASQSADAATNSARPVSQVVTAAAGGGEIRYEPVETAEPEKVARSDDSPRKRTDHVSRLVREALDPSFPGQETESGEEVHVGGMSVELEQEIDEEIGVFLGSPIGDGAKADADPDAATPVEAARDGERREVSDAEGVSGFSMLEQEDRERLLSTFGDRSGADSDPDETGEPDLAASDGDDEDPDEELLALEEEEEDDEVLASDGDDKTEPVAAESGNEGEEASISEAAESPTAVIAASEGAFNRSVEDATGLGRSILAHRSEAEPSEHEVTLLFKGMSGKRVQLAGDFNGWIPDRGVYTRIQDGTLIKTMKLEMGEYQYRVVVDGIWQEDPGNPERVANIYGGSNSLLRVHGKEERPAI